MTANDIIRVNIKDLAHMIAHKCQYCKYKEAQCSEINGCENGILGWLKDEICNS